MMWQHGGMWGWGFVPMFLGGIFPLLLIGLLVFLVVQAFAGRQAPAVPPPGFAPPPPPHRGETALEIAERRYAAGELSRDEFMRIREDMRPVASAPPPPPEP